MKFFKHFTDSHEGRSMMTLFDNLGHTGIACYWILVEMCAAKLGEIIDQKGGERLTEIDCKFNFHARLVRQKLRISQAKVQLFLGECSTLGLLSYQIDGSSVQILMPKLLKCLERTKKKDVKATSKLRRNDVLDKIRQDKDQDQDQEATSPPPNYAAFSDHYDPEKAEIVERAGLVIAEVLGSALSPGFRNLIPAMLRSVNWDVEAFSEICGKLKTQFDDRIARGDLAPPAYREKALKSEFGLIREVS